MIRLTALGLTALAFLLPLFLSGQPEVHLTVAFNDHFLPYGDSRFTATPGGADGIGHFGLNLGVELYFSEPGEKFPFLLSLNRGTVFSTDLRIPYSVSLSADATGPARRVFAQASLDAYNYWQFGISFQPIRISKKRHGRLMFGVGMTYINGTRLHSALAEQIVGTERLQAPSSAYRIENGDLGQIDGPARLEVSDQLLRPVHFFGEVGIVSHTTNNTQGYTSIQVNLHSVAAPQIPNDFLKGQLSFNLRIGARG
ncbi:MAG: hypothetical protein AAGA62_13720, partial [Bacteroidota bacterium]